MNICRDSTNEAVRKTFVSSRLANVSKICLRSLNRSANDCHLIAGLDFANRAAIDCGSLLSLRRDGAMERQSMIVTAGVAALLALPVACRTQPRAEAETSRRAALEEQQPGGGAPTAAPAGVPRPPAAAAPFGCGAVTCGPDQFCVRYTQICLPTPADKPCPPGSTRTTCGESMSPGCIRPPCDGVAPHCADLPAICGATPSCGCANDVCAPSPCTAFSIEKREFTCVCP
jgi:hypothetical protein